MDIKAELDNIETLMALMTKYKVDMIEIGEIKLIKNHHLVHETEQTTPADSTKTQEEIDDELLFHSAN